MGRGANRTRMMTGRSRQDRRRQAPELLHAQLRTRGEFRGYELPSEADPGWLDRKVRGHITPLDMFPLPPKVLFREWPG